tara:strand:- start:14255 stop:14557 length:303 start_codon:yes stop_codon:yes gene_type:complete
LPVLLGLASITVSIVGVITGDVPDSVVGDRAQIGSIGAMNGTDAVGAARPDVVSRSSDRERLGDVTAAKLGGPSRSAGRAASSCLPRRHDGERPRHYYET